MLLDAPAAACRYVACFAPLFASPLSLIRYICYAAAITPAGHYWLRFTSHSERFRFDTPRHALRATYFMISRRAMPAPLFISA